MKKAATIFLILLMQISSASAQKWVCQSLSAVDHGYRCPTIECELITGEYFGISNGLAAKATMNSLCTASTNNQIDRFVVVGFIEPETEKHLMDVSTDPCSYEIAVETMTGILFGEYTPEAFPLVGRAIIEFADANVISVKREIRDSKCSWEKGL